MPRTTEHVAAHGGPASAEPVAALLFAAGGLDATPDGPAPCQVLNGKLAAPRLYTRPLTLAECEAAATGAPPADGFAAWDFSLDTDTDRLTDTAAGGSHGRTVNRPARRMTGPVWSGDFQAAAGYDAIHFHDDDVADAGWPESIGLVIPADWRSGVYALRIRADGDEDHLPFFVCPPCGGGANAIAMLMPTFSYLAYSNESIDATASLAMAPLQDMTLRPAVFRYIAENGLKSTYDSHGDGSGICHASLRRPILDFRPKARCRGFDAPHQFAADLHLVDWLEEKGFAFDIVTDHELHAEGAEVLAPYQVVLTGSHPEYWSAAMIHARDSWLESGGRLMYLGGNGFYWVTAVAKDDPGLIEVRRFTGTRTWHAEPGEVWLSLDGGMGGLWRDRGHAPQKSVGVGFTGQGFDRGVPYLRGAASHRPEFAFIFDGVADDRVGAGPALVLNHGAAGFEVDKADPRLGTPAHAVVLATSAPFTDAYQFVVEETIAGTPWSGGSVNPRLGADIVLLEYPNNGAVFSVGSISWSSTLSFAGYDSDTSRITANVLRAFSRPDWHDAVAI
jgi:N,N-dimethylformamidase